MGFIEYITLRYVAFISMLDPRRRLIRNEIRRSLRNLLPPVNMVVDIGAGHAPYRAFFTSRGYIAVEVNRTHRPAVIGDVMSLPFANNTAQLVLLTEVLEHVPKPEEAVCEVARILEQGGWLLLSVPFMFGEHEKVDYHSIEKKGGPLLCSAGEERIMTRTPLVIQSHQAGHGRPVLIVRWRDIERPLALIVFAALGGLLVYTLALRQGQSPSVIWYWLLIGIIDGAIMLQILLRLRGSHVNGEWRILTQILSLKVLLSLMIVWSAPNGLFGSDPHYNLSATAAIGLWGWPVPDSAGLLHKTMVYTQWPGMDFLNLTISKVSGLSHFQIARYLPGALGMLSIVFVYIAGKRMFGSGHSGLLAALAMAHITTAVVFHSWYVREAFAFPLLMGLAALSVRSRFNAGDRAVALVILGSLVFYHHLTSFVAMLLLATMAVVYWAESSGWFGLGSHRLQGLMNWKSDGHGLLALLVAVIFFFYALYIGPLVIAVMVGAMKLLVTLDVGSPYLEVTRDATRQFIFYGRWAVTFVMGMTVLTYLVYRRVVLKAGPRWSLAEGPLFLWVVLVGVWTLASNYGGILVGADPARLLIFGFPFLLLLFAQVILHLHTSRGLISSTLTRLGIATLAVFLAVNLLGFPSYAYNASGQPDYSFGEARKSFTAELYAANQWQDQVLASDAVLAGDSITDEVLGGLSQRQIAPDVDFFAHPGKFHRYDGFVLRSGMRRMSHFNNGPFDRQRISLSQENLDTLLSLRQFFLVYDNGEIQIGASRRLS
jgi:SAM-dependent methyltransferase